MLQEFSFKGFSRRPLLWLRTGFWFFGIVLAFAQAWSYRYYMSADAISYLDMSDAILPGYSWGKLVNGVWSPLYPALLGIGRALLKPSPYQEIVTTHLLNLVFFLFAFACFEFMLKSLLSRRAETELAMLMPDWACLILAYAIFLWASISQITLTTLRPDMLMSGFVYLAMGILLPMTGRAPSWRAYLGLGVVLGVGFLAKAPMLPLGLLLIASSLFLVTSWRSAFAPAVCAGIIVLVIGSCYFVPLSRLRGHFTLGESGAFNYLYHVDGIGPTWYVQERGEASGTLLRKPDKVFDAPPTYRFAFPYPVTHPLRFDPAYWTEGLKPRVRLSAQYEAIRENLHVIAGISALGALVVAFVVLLSVADTWSALLRLWPLWVSGLFGVAMYLVIHVEPRYIGVFWVLLWLGLLVGLRPPPDWRNRLLTGVTAGIVIALLIPTIESSMYDFHKMGYGRKDAAIEAAIALRRYGVCPGDPVARVSRDITELAWARVSRTTVVAEVDWAFAEQFWQAGPAVQREILQSMAGSGAKVVVAHLLSGGAPPSGWTRLGHTPFWVYPLVPMGQPACSTQNGRL